MSSVSQIPNFGYAWSLTVTNPPNSEGLSRQTTIESLGWQPEPLRITFEVNQVGYSSHQEFWSASISIYNLRSDEAQDFLFGQGAHIVLSVGYQNPGPKVIFDGSVYQALYERPDVVDSKVTLLCYVGMKETIGNFCQFRGTAQSTQAALIAKMAAGSNTPLTLAQALDPSLSATKLPRARPFFGNPHKFIDSVASCNDMVSWYGHDGLNLSTGQDANSISTITYTPNAGIIGVPQQTQDGVSFTVYLDNRLRVQTPMMQVDISASIIRQLPQPPPIGRKLFPPLLDPKGLYLVNAVQHRGDSRGNVWESQITAFTSIGGKLAMIFAQNGQTLDRRAPR